MLCPCVRRVRTGQLAVIGGYCADLRERCEVLTDAQGEMKERLRAARLREMALSTELESVAMRLYRTCTTWANSTRCAIIISLGPSMSS